ncbi:hypothetical protein [Deinococcus sp. AJ005]|uniref:hypothetical protein n=1 Tax=Deinococcus sp. AJ005 TaxID=2652443 RepID=UPI00125CC51F|nr:hypothetical protein [Deinococcus sp. AJ005]QFP77043.1 hypothetical protein DAAJ005_11745 [Deinococcus sp. AJ005]
MKSARRLQPLLSRLMAVLTVLAAFAFQARVGGMVDLPMLGMSGMVRMAGYPMSGHQMAGMPVGPSAASALPVPQPQQGQGDRESHNHAAHCPFCVTGAFALEAGVLPLPTAPPRQISRPLPLAVADVPAVPRHADARAPPVSL